MSRNRRLSSGLTLLAVAAAAFGAGSFALQAAEPVKPAAQIASAKKAQNKTVEITAEACAVPQAMISQEQPLKRVAEKLRDGEAVVIVAIGSSSTAGHGATSPNRSYPVRLAAELRTLWPRTEITVFNRGVGGERTPQMIARFQQDVFAEDPDLVIWQVGTNDALIGDPVEAGRIDILDGIEKIKASGADLILMSQQFAPRFNEKTDHLARVEAVRSAAELENVGLFRRFQIMQSWLARAQMTAATMLSSDGLHMSDLSYGCVAHLLAQQIAAASRSAPVVASSPTTRNSTGNTR